MQLSCCLGKHLSQDILERDLSNHCYTMEIIMFYCAAAGAIFALTEMITLPWTCSQEEDGCSFSLLLQLIHKEIFPRPQGYICPQRALKNYLHSQLLYCLQFSTHTTFFPWFFPGRTGVILLPSLLQQSQEEEDAHFKNNSTLPWAHLAQWLKQSLQILPFPVFNHFNLVRALHPFCWFTSIGCFASCE